MGAKYIETLGDKISRQQTPGQIAANEKKLAEVLVDREGGNIGQNNVTTFTATVDQTGGLQEIQYRRGNLSNKKIANDGTDAYKNDGVAKALTESMDEIKFISACCSRDGTKDCAVEWASAKKDAEEKNESAKNNSIRVPTANTVNAPIIDGASGANPFGDLGLPGKSK